MTAVPLTQAVTSGDADAVSAVLAAGADVNQRTGGGQTPLILATIFGHTHLIPLLLEAGADLRLRDNLGLNAIDWAQRRGATDAIQIFKDKNRSLPPTKTDARVPERSAVKVEPEAERPRPVSAEEKSQRWIAGLKQRIAEQAKREIPDGPNIFWQQPETPPEPEAPLKLEPEAPPEPEPVELQPEPKAETPIEEISVEVSGPVPETPRKSTSRKRCPKCNAIYNSELLAYCAHHFVELVDADEPPIISEPPRTSPVMFWMLIVITLSGSIVLGTLLAPRFYAPKQPPPQVATPPSASNPTQKGIPSAGRELAGRVVSLPVAECELNGQEPIPGTVVVRVTIDRNGLVKSARASGGDWLLRGAATEAAMKSTFAPGKLRSREIEGTITYTFEP